MVEHGVVALVTILFGAFAGGVTNAIAVWMLFHPYEPPRIAGIRLSWLHGAIPKNKKRLASAIGRTVGTRLLTGDDIGRALAAPAFRDAFDARLESFLSTLLEGEHASLQDVLPAQIATELRRILQEAGDAIHGRLDAYLESDAFQAAAVEWARELATQLEGEPIAEVLTPERGAALTTAADQWMAELVQGEAFARTVHGTIDRAANRLLEPERTFEDVIPAGLVAALERSIAGYLPLAIERLAGLLEEPGARAGVERALHEILDRFMSDLKFHQRIFAALLIPPDAVDRILTVIEKEGAGKIAELLHDDTVREAMARRVSQGILDFLKRPVRTVLGEPGETAVEEGKQAVSVAVLNLAREPGTRTYLVEKLGSSLRAAERRTFGELFVHLPPDRVASGIVSAARSEPMQRLYREAIDRTMNAVMTRKIGRPADLVQGDSLGRVRSAVAEPLWTWLQDQVPVVVERVDVAGRVEQKVLEYPTAQLEALIRGVTQRELRLIVQLGYVLGAMIGAISALIGIAL